MTISRLVELIIRCLSCNNLLAIFLAHMTYHADEEKHTGDGKSARVTKETNVLECCQRHNDDQSHENNEVVSIQIPRAV